MKQPNPGPCLYNRRPPHAHSFVRGVCHRCGARDETTVDETPWRELEAARVEFRKAVDAFYDEVGRTGLASVEARQRWYALANRITDLRLQESKWSEG